MGRKKREVYVSILRLGEEMRLRGVRLDIFWVLSKGKIEIDWLVLIKKEMRQNWHRWLFRFGGGEEDEQVFVDHPPFQPPDKAFFPFVRWPEEICRPNSLHISLAGRLGIATLMLTKKSFFILSNFSRIWIFLLLLEGPFSPSPSTSSCSSSSFHPFTSSPCHKFPENSSTLPHCTDTINKYRLNWMFETSLGKAATWNEVLFCSTVHRLPVTSLPKTGKGWKK